VRVSDLGDLSMLELFREEAGSQLEALAAGLVALESGGDHADVCERLMRAAHSLKGAARIVDLGAIVKLAHALEDYFVAAQAGTVRVAPEQIDVLLEVVDFITRTLAGPDVEAALREGDAAVADRVAALGVLREGGVLARAAASDAPGDPSPPEPAPPTPSASAPERRTTAAPTTPSATPERSLKVGADALARVAGLAAEALVESGRLQPLADGLVALRLRQSELRSVLLRLGRALSEGRERASAETLVQHALAGLERLRSDLAERATALDNVSRRATLVCERLHREATATRMRPFGSVLRGYPRLVRDLARELGKRCRLEITGETTAVDRDVLDALETPLNHLVRNAVDHGLEPEAERLAAGKPAEARLELGARHRAGRLVVEVRDDGRGIDVETLRAEIVARGLATIPVAEALSPAEVLEFLFLPGFTTRDAVSEISGRGVGLDGVRTMVQESGGQVAIETAPGRGTTFRLVLPITKSVLRCLMVEIAGQAYAFPLARVERVLAVEPASVRTIEGRPFVSLGGEEIALVPAAEILELPDDAARPATTPVVVVRDDGRPFGLEVTALAGERDLVVRPLDDLLGRVPDVGAAAIDEDGGPVLILDVDHLVRSIEALLSGDRLRRGRHAARDETTRARRRVLVVDDSVTVRQAEAQMLESRGYAVDVAVDGVEAWNLIRLGSYDLVVTDVDMPRMNGIDLVRKIRADPRTHELPVMIVSYKDRPEDRMRGLEAGASFYLPKGGFEDRALLDAVADLIGEADAETAS
jgi:two-component system sensor histidine kinase and response regulator WspE